jgi:hypothetical protein
LYPALFAGLLNRTMSEQLDLLRKIHFGVVSETELMDIFYRYKDDYRMQMNLVMHPRFPEKFAMNIVARLFPIDLVRVIKNKRTNPFIRKKAELEFRNKYSKFPLGEKLSYMKVAPYALLRHFVDEKDKRVLEVILKNASCTEDLVLRLVNRESPRHELYEVILSTEWYKRPAVAEAIANDAQASIRMLIEILPFISKRTLRKLYEKEETHSIVKINIVRYYGKNRE